MAQQSAHRTHNPVVLGLNPLWPLAGFVLSCPNFKYLATLVYSQLVTSNQLGLLILLCCV